MIKRKLVVYILLCLLPIGTVNNAHAQFWKKKSARKHAKNKKSNPETDSSETPVKQTEKERRKEERKKEKEARRKERRERKLRHKQGIEEPAKKIKVPKTVKKKEIKYPPSVFKNRYRVDVLAPLYLDEISKATTQGAKDKIAEKANTGVAFYEGINIAADSMKRAGFNVEIYVHDITSVSESPAMLAGKNMLDSSNLIIGAVSTKEIPFFADYARKIHVNFISVLSPSDAGVNDNPYFTLLQPSLKSHCEWITTDIDKKFHGQKIALLYRTSIQPEENAYKYITGGNAAKINTSRLLCNALPTKESLAQLFDLNKPNVVIVSVLDNAYADSLLRLLTVYFPGTHFEVYGMPSWKTLVDLNKISSYPNLSINITYPFYFNSSMPIVQYIDRACKNEFDHKGSELVYRGYETMYWYASLLKQYGTVFNDKYSDNTAAPITKFDVKMQWDANGNVLYNENTRIFLSTYEGGTHKTD